jgi:hypothetical protein
MKQILHFSYKPCVTYTFKYMIYKIESVFCRTCKRRARYKFLQYSGLCILR